MKIKNKLVIANLTVFSLFLATFLLFYFSAARLMEMKDLQKEAMQLRSLILRLGYANNAILKSADLPIQNLKWAYDELYEELDIIAQNTSMENLNEATTDRFRDIYGFLQNRQFEEYYRTISEAIETIKPHMDKRSIEVIHLDWARGVPLSGDFYSEVLKVRYRVNEFSVWYLPFSEQFKIISLEIMASINKQIRLTIILTALALAVSLLVSISVILFIYKNMVENIRNVRQGIERISGGNLNTRIAVRTKDELGTMGENFNALTETIWQRLNTIGSIIHNIGQSLSQDPDSTNLEKTILQLSIENTRADNGAFYKPDRERRVLIPRHGTDRFALPYDEDLYREEVPFGKTIIGMAAVSGEPYFMKETGGQNLIPGRTSFDRHYISSCIILPLISEKEVVGIICLEKNDDRERFRDMDYSNILSFIEFSAVTLRNLEKYSELLHSTGLNREMQIASDIQKSLLPPKIPKVPGFDISVKTYSVKGISGDIYDFFPVDKGRWLFCLAEVLEKGIASSMMLVILRTLIRILVRSDQDPAELLTALLKNFTETTGLSTAVRISLCLMEPGDERFTYCGTEKQNLLLFRQETGGVELIESRSGREGEFRSVEGVLREGDHLVCMTDGFYNAKNAEGESYGWNPVGKILKKYNQRSCSWLQDAVLKDVSYFEREGNQSDDRTLFVAGYKGGKK